MFARMSQRLLRGGQVVDGTGGAARRADVLVDGDRIRAVAPGLSAAADVETIDCGGLVVCPGFIDTHSHSDLRVLVEPDLPMKVRQGVTLDVLGQDGISVAPLRDDDLEQARRQLAGLLGDPNVPWSWRSVGDYLSLLDGGAALHTSYLVPHGAARGLVMGLEDRAATEEELRRMVEVVGRGMAEGALGMSTGLIYPPCCYAATDELVALCSEVARRDGVFVVHMRSESDRILTAVEEMLEVARRSGVHLHISHIKIAGRRNWPQIDRMISLVEEAVAREGLRVTADQYPYVAGSTMFGAILPPWAHAGGVRATLERLASREQRARMRAAMQHEGENEWDNFWAWTGPEGIVISDLPSGRRPAIVGRTVAEAAAASQQDPVEFAFDLLRDEQMAVSMISFSQTEEVVGRLMRLPWVNGCTDGLLGGRPHPRAYGTFPRLLGRYAREQGVLPLEEMVRKLTSQAADAMHLDGRGRVAPGLVADLVAFDPATVADRATFAEPTQFPVGVEHVLVAGVPVVQRSNPTGARPGRTVRHPRLHEADDGRTR
jgi:N-acyl-D-amino-acid deacylase